MLVALALGADTIMLGRFLAGTNESPIEINFNMSPPKKPYWGEGSARAKSWREKRGYNYEFDEGVEAWVDYVGPLERYLNQAMMQLIDGIRKSGTYSIDGLHRDAVVEVISEDDASPSVLSEVSTK
jgi:IMP dehydrogenase